VTLAGGGLRHHADMQRSTEIVRRTLPDGRVMLFEQWDVGAALGGVTWHVRFETDPGNPATGTPLLVVVALLLGYELVPETWPWWVYGLAADVESSFAVRP
jgi:hypothetical protein